MSEELNKITEKISDLSPEQKEEILTNFSEFKGYLKKQLAKGEKLGLSNEVLAKGAKFVADHLAKNEEPKNREQKLLQELWNVSGEDEKKSLAYVLVKMVQSD
ncbi:MAG: DUF3243 domain-containing protein [Kurthia sp.]|nr:DUF3243 domain-containing protein [Candidatus Kurthia equi]